MRPESAITFREEPEPGETTNIPILRQRTRAFVTLLAEPLRREGRLLCN